MMTVRRGLALCLLALVALATPAAARSPAAVPKHRADGRLNDWRGDPTMLSGQTTISCGELIYTDYLFDDYGPNLDRVPNETPFTAPLTRTSGDYRYPQEPARLGQNAADLRELRVAADAKALHVLVLMETMKVPDAAIATIAIDTDASRATGASVAPDGSRVRAPGADRFITLWGSGGRVADGAGSSAALAVAANTEENAYEARVPRIALGPIAPNARLWVFAGLAAAGERQYAAQRGDATAAFDVGFQGKEDYGTVRVGPDGLAAFSLWSERRQSAALAAGDLSDFSHALELDALVARGSLQFRPEPGFYNRLFKSRYDVGEGVLTGRTDPLDPTEVMFKSRYQPYGLYIPEGYDRARPARLLLDGHSFSLNMNQTAAISPNRLRELGDQRDAIIVTPFARGPDVTYHSWGLADVFEAWDDVRRNYAIDDDRTDLAGLAAGGYLTYRLGLLVPDRFARAAVHLGPAKHPTYLGPGLPSPTPKRLEVTGDTTLLIPNALNLPFELNYSTAAPLVPITGGRDVERQFRAAGNAYRFYDNPAAVEPFDLLVFDTWKHTARWLGTERRNLSPPRVRYVRYPVNDLPQFGLRFDRAYWIADLVVRDLSAGERANGQIDATTFALGATAPAVAPEPARLEPDGGEGPAIVTGQQHLDGSLVKRRNAFSATLRNVSSVRLLTARMGLDPRAPASAALRGDGVTTLRFDGRWPRRLRATLDGATVALTRDRRGRITVKATLTPGKEHQLTIGPANPAGRTSKG